MHHSLCGKSVADSATVITKALHIYAGNQSDTCLFHDSAYYSFKNCTTARNIVASNKVNQWLPTKSIMWIGPLHDLTVQSTDQIGLLEWCIVIVIVAILVYHSLPSAPSQKCAFLPSHFVFGDECWLMSMIIINHLNVIINIVVVIIIIVIQSIGWKSAWYYRYCTIHRAAEFFSPAPVPDWRGNICSDGGHSFYVLLGGCCMVLGNHPKMCFLP